MSTEAEVAAATQAILNRPVDVAGPVRQEAREDARVALAAVEPLIRERLAQEVEVAVLNERYSYPTTDAQCGYNDAVSELAIITARIVRGDAS